MKKRIKNPIAKDLRTPKYRQRVEKPKNKYNRRPKNKGKLWTYHH